MKPHRTFPNILISNSLRSYRLLALNTQNYFLKVLLQKEAGTSDVYSEDTRFKSSHRLTIDNTHIVVGCVARYSAPRKAFVPCPVHMHSPISITTAIPKAWICNLIFLKKGIGLNLFDMGGMQKGSVLTALSHLPVIITLFVEEAKGPDISQFCITLFYYTK